MDLRDFAKKSDENSDNYKNSLIIKFCLFWILLMLISFMIYLFTKKIGVMLLWLGIYAVFRRQLIFDKKLNKQWELIKSNIFIKIFDTVIIIIFVIMFIFGHIF
jgi:hypothetical protein